MIFVTTFVQDYQTLVACSNSEHTLVVIIVTTLVNLFLLLVVVAAARMSSHCKKDIAQVSSRMSSSYSTGFCIFNSFFYLINVDFCLGLLQIKNQYYFLSYCWQAFNSCLVNLTSLKEGLFLLFQN